MSNHGHRVTNHVGEYVVRGPRSTDAVGHTLRGAFAVAALPADMQAALDALTRQRHA